MVANAITAKGVSTSTSATFSTMATNIGKINTGIKQNGKNFSIGSISCNKGDKIIIHSVFVATFTGATVNNSINMCDHSGNVVFAKYELTATSTTVNLNFQYAGDWSYIIY